MNFPKINLPKKRIAKISAGVLLALIVGYFLFWPKTATVAYVTEKAKKGTVEQVVSVTGTVSADKRIDLHFQKGGKVASVGVKEGDPVAEGDLLASLDSSTLDIQVQQAAASLESAEAALQLRLAGATDQEIALAQKDVDSAQVAYDVAVKGLANTKASTEAGLRKAEVTLKNARSSSGVNSTSSQQAVRDAYTNSKSSVTLALISARNAMNKMDEVMGINNEKLNDGFEDFLGGKNFTTKGAAVTAFTKAEGQLRTMEQQFASIGGAWTPEAADSFLPDVIAGLRTVREASRATFVLLDNSTPAGAVLTQALIDAFKASVSTNESALESSISTLEKSAQAVTNAKLGQDSTGLSSSTALENAQTAYDQTVVENAKLVDAAQADVQIKRSSLEKAQVALDLKRATPRPVDTAGLRAQVAAAQASYDLALQNVADSRIVSPIDGIVTNVPIEEGQNVTGAENAVTVITEQQVVKANVSETDVSKVKVGQTVTMTLDAFPRDQVFAGTIADINPAETVVQGVIYYQITLTFDTDEEGIKPGMTANIEVVAARKEGALSIPPQALQYKDNKPYVRVLEGGVPVEKGITLGIQGNTTVEVTDGLKEGEEVVLSEKK